MWIPALLPRTGILSIIIWRKRFTGSLCRFPPPRSSPVRRRHGSRSTRERNFGGLLNIAEAIAALDRQVPNPSAGLPEELFLYISRTTPLVNVDLLIKDENGRTLLAWRDDQYSGKGWHVPGGIGRFKEPLERRGTK